MRRANQERDPNRRRLLMVMIARVFGGSTLYLPLSSQAKRPRFLKHGAVVVNPGAALAKKAAEAAAPLAEVAAKAAGSDPETAKKLLATGADPAPTIVSLAKNEVALSFKSTLTTVQVARKFLTAVADGNAAGVGEALVQIQWGVGLQQAMGPGVVFVFETTSKMIPQGDRAGLMENPNVRWVAPNGDLLAAGPSQHPVYYVNGMLTQEPTAVEEARAIAGHIKRPVGLIYNDTKSDKEGAKEDLTACFEDVGKACGKGVGFDGTEAIMDRVWPATLSMFNGLGPGRVRQHNRTTRRVTQVLHHATGPFSVISHSQGCLIVRNALLTAAKMRDREEPEKWMHWIAAGLPLRNEELVVKPKVFKPLPNNGDTVSHLLGLRLLTESESGEIRKTGGHSFIKHYVPYIELEWLSNG